MYFWYIHLVLHFLLMFVLVCYELVCFFSFLNFLIICTEVFLLCFQYMGSPYKRSIRLLGYYPSHII